MAESFNDAVFTRQEHTIGIAVTCEVQAVTASSRVNSKSVQDSLVKLAEKLVTGRPVHVLALVMGEETTATLMLADEQEIRAADVRRWMAEACKVPAEQVTVTKFVGVHAVIGQLAGDSDDDEERRLDGWCRDAPD